MTRISAAVAGTVALVFLTGCAASRNPSVTQLRSTATPISPFERLWVAGFVSDSIRGVDVNGETVRLLRAELYKQGRVRVLSGEALRLEGEDVFADSAYWRRVGEEHGNPVIVTGSVTLRAAPPNVIQPVGRAAGYILQPGFFLESRIVLVDGTTGEVVFSRRMPRQVRYGAGRHGSPMFMYLLMMDELMPDLLRAVTGVPNS